MSGKKFYDEILLDLHYRQSHDLRVFLGTYKNSRKKVLSKTYFNDQVALLQYEITSTEVKNAYKSEFSDQNTLKLKWKIQGRGVITKKKNFKEWYDQKRDDEFNWFLRNRTENFIYIFWGNNKKCLYIGRTGKGGSRALSHFTKYWFSRATHIEIFHTSNSRRLNKMECLAIHYYQPSYNVVKSARQKSAHVCSICDHQKYIKSQMNKIYYNK